MCPSPGLGSLKAQRQPSAGGVALSSLPHRPAGAEDIANRPGEREAGRTSSNGEDPSASAPASASSPFPLCEGLLPEHLLPSPRTRRWRTTLSQGSGKMSSSPLRKGLEDREGQWKEATLRGQGGMKEQGGDPETRTSGHSHAHVTLARSQAFLYNKAGALVHPKPHV